MKEIQIPRKNFARSSNPGTKNRKFTEKKQSATFSDVSLESTKDPADSTPISQISEAESNSSDCVVLDGDPYKTTPNEKEIETWENDEVLVVGQKGEIACRDFPHPRHACAKYPFNTSSHQNYCEMCHCYVCEKIAPCTFWCVGASSFDHCHANDKEKIWKTLRECIRTTVSEQKLAEKKQSTTMKDPADSIQISCSDSNAEINESPVSTITNVEAHMEVSSTDRIQSIVDLPDESKWKKKKKLGIVLLSFIVWAILATIVVSFSSGRDDPYYGPLPT